jgi:hypothetical protein
MCIFQFFTRIFHAAFWKKAEIYMVLFSIILLF